MKVAVVLVVCLLQNVFGANPNYSYHVKIDDPAHVNFQEKAETRKGEDAQGFYSVLEPNGALRTVSYTADDRGFNPIVSYSYGHPQSSVAVHSASGAAAIVKQSGVYAPAYVSDNRVQIVDKSNIYAAPPPAINFEAFRLPGPSAPVVVPAPLRVAAPVRLASAAIATNYAPAYVPSPAAYLPPQPAPQVFAVKQQHQVIVQQPQVVVRQQPQVLAIPQPQVYQQQVVVQQPQVYQQQTVVQQPQVFAVPQKQVFAVAQPQVIVQQPQVLAVKRVRPAKFLTVPAPPPPAAIAVVQDSYAEPPRDTFRNPDAPVYPDAVKVELNAEYGPPNYQPPPPITEAPLKVQVVEQAPIKVIEKPKVIQPVVQEISYLPPPAPVVQVQKVVAQAPPAFAIAQQTIAAAPLPVATGLYAGAIGFHTHTVNPDSYIHNYGTEGFQVTSSRKFNKAVLAVPQFQKQIFSAPPPPQIAVQTLVKAPTPVYGPPPAVAVQTLVRAPTPVYGPPPQAVRVVQPRPVYGPPPATIVQQQLSVAQPIEAVQSYAPAAPLLTAPAPAVSFTSSPLLSAPAAPAISLTGKKQNPLTFAYSYDQGPAKVSHSYSGSGW